MFLSDIGINVNLIHKIKAPEQILLFLGNRIFDVDYRTPPPNVILPENVGEEVQMYYSSPRSPQYVVRATFLPTLLNAGFTLETMFDISSLFSANQVSTVVGDLRLLDTAAALSPHIENAAYLVRCDGDEMAVMRRPKLGENTSIPTQDQIKHYIEGNAKGLLRDEQGKNVFDKITVAFLPRLPERLQRLRPFPEHPLEERIRRLERFHPETKNTNRSIITIPDLQEQSKLIRVEEVSLEHPRLQEVIERINQERGMENALYEDRGDFVQHLASEKDKYTMIRLDVAGVLHEMNKISDNTADNFLEWELTSIINAMQEALPDIKRLPIYVRGADFYVALPPALPDDIKDIRNVLIERLTTKYQFIGEDSRENEIPVIFSTIGFSLYLRKQSQTENRRRFFEHMEKTNSKIWTENKSNIKRFYQRDDITEKDWNFLAIMINPTDKKRGLPRLNLMQIPQEYTNTLLTCYTRPDNPRIQPGILKQEDFDRFISIVKKIFVIEQGSRRSNIKSCYANRNIL